MVHVQWKNRLIIAISSWKEYQCQPHMHKEIQKKRKEDIVN